MPKTQKHYYFIFSSFLFYCFLAHVPNEAAFLKNVKGKFEDYKNQADEAKGKFDDYKGKADEAKGKFDEYKGKVEEVKGKFDEYKGKVEEVRGKFDDYKDNINGSNSSLETTNSMEVAPEADTYKQNKYSSADNNNHGVFAISSDITAKGLDNNEWYRKYSQKIIPYSLSEKIKLRLQEDKKLFGYLLFAFVFLIFLCIIVCYLFYKDKNILAFQVLAFLIFNLILTLDLILVLFEHQSRISDHIELFKDFIFLCAASAMSFASGMFMMKEYFSKKRLP